MIFSMILGYTLAHYYDESKKWFYLHSAFIGVAIGVIAGGIGIPISFPFWWIIANIMGPAPLVISYELLFLFNSTGFVIADYTPLFPMIIMIGINVGSVDINKAWSFII